jgi:hypothetical protein
MRREHAQHVRAARKRTAVDHPRSARALPACVPREAASTRVKAQLLPDYLPGPTTRNFGRATTIFDGSDQDIC